MKHMNKKYMNFLGAIIGFTVGVTGIATVAFTNPFH
ncbi:MAG: hypothetical protein QOI71_2607 [Gaiellales bacterium]|jgi:hypothetical protein|nr:hypothetical protein [Gaiellales bacterium]MDX6618173.1 hypothetical protein [Gaiellales bacterium]